LPDIQQQFVDVYGPQGLQAIAIDPDSDDYLDPGAVAAFVANQGVNFQVAVQETAITPTYSTIEGIYDGANPYPVDILIDKQGIIRYVSREYDPVAIDDMIQTLLAEP
jgi:hypothetical protein